MTVAVEARDERRTRTLPAEPGAGSEARRWAAAVTKGLLEADQAQSLRLIISELVTNALRHAGLNDDERIALAVGVTPAAVRVEVTDHGRGFDPDAIPSDPEAAEGWGLYLVATLADRWGAESDEKATRVWFELDRTLPEAA